MQPEKRSLLLVGAAPTPNGRLHLGHLGGQFLKLDVLKRAHERRGGKALLLCGIDAYDSTLSYVGAKRGTSEAALVDECYRGMREDLETAAIGCDAFVNYTDPVWAPRVRDGLAAVERMLASHLVEKEERVPFSARTGAPLTGRWLAGACPRCGRRIQGLCCDPCSLYFSPEEVRDVRPVEAEDAITWRTVKNRFVRVPSRVIERYLSAMPLRESLRTFAGSVLVGDEILVRWTAFEPWGVPTGVPGQVYCNRVVATIVEQALFGEIARDRWGLSANAFSLPEVDTLFAYGIDNAGVLLVDAPALALATGSLRPYDRHLVSEFVLLDGEKMSTGRPHAIWVDDIRRDPGLTTDGVRAYLLAAAFPGAQVDVRRDGLRRFCEEFEVTIAREALAVAEGVTLRETSGETAALFARFSTAQDEALAREDFPALLPLAREALAAARALPAEKRFTGAAGLASTFQPVAPELSRRIVEKVTGASSLSGRGAPPLRK